MEALTKSPIGDNEYHSYLYLSYLCYVSMAMSEKDLQKLSNNAQFESSECLQSVFYWLTLFVLGNPYTGISSGSTLFAN